MTFATDVLSFEQHVNTWFVTTEQQVAVIVGQIKADIDVAIQDVDKAVQWAVTQIPTVTADLQTAAGLVEAIPGAAANPEVAAAIVAANVAVAGLNAFATATNSGKTLPQAAVQGYVAVQAATQAVAAAKVAASNSNAPSAAAAVANAATAPTS